MELWLALLVLWLWECLAFLPPGGMAFTVSRRGSAGVRRASGLHLSGLWPLRLSFSLDGLPYEVTEDEVIGAGPLTLFAATGAGREERVHPLDGADAESAGPLVRTRTGALLRASSEVAAQRIAAALGVVTRAERSARPVIARIRLVSGLAIADPDARIARVRRATLPHRALAALSLAGIALGPPALAVSTQFAWSSIWENTWPLWIGLHALGFVALLAAELRLRAPGRGGRLFRAAIYPPAQWRGSHELASAALGDVHPLAALCALLPAAQLEPWARRTLAECDHPRFDLPHPTTGARAEARRAALSDRRHVLAQVFERAGIGPAQLAAPPARRDANAASYCPRCFEEFVATGWVCTDCQLETRAYPRG